MANTLNNLLPDLYAAIDVVSRELTGFIPSVSRNSNAERAAKNETVRVPVTTSETAKDISPGPNVPDDGDTTVNNRTINITEFRRVPVRFSGEEEMGLRNGGTFENIRQERFFQAMRTLVNEIETDLAEQYFHAHRAVGGAGTTPFGTKDDLSDFAEAARILDENGAPKTDRQLVVGTAAMSNLRGTQTGLLQRLNEAGTDEALRDGMFDPVHGLNIRNSDQVVSHTKGGGSSYQTDGASIAAGDTSIPIDTGTGTLKQGDLFTASGNDTDKYLVQADQTGAGSVTISEPGLEAAIADNTAITDPKDYVANMAFHRNAIQLATRTPAMPEGGDKARDRTVVEDPQTGLAFDVAEYPGFHSLHYDVSIAWGYSTTKEEHMALVLG